MKINKNEFRKALETVKPGLATKDIIEQTTSFCFFEGKVITYNDEISIAYPLKQIDFSGAVNATELYAFINKVKADEIEIAVTGGEILLKAGRSKAGLTLQAEIVLPVKEIGKIHKWKKLPQNFLNALDFAMASCSRDMSKPILTCVHINKQKVESCDNYRATRYVLKEEVPIKAFLLPANTCPKVIKMKPVEIAEGRGWVHFKTENGAILSCRTFEDSYVNLDNFLSTKGKKITFPKTLIDLLDRAAIFSKRDYALDESVHISINNKKLQIKSFSESGWFAEKVKIDYSGDNIEFRITPYLLQSILKQTTTGVLSSDRLLFSGKNWKYLTLLKQG